MKNETISVPLVSLADQIAAGNSFLLIHCAKNEAAAKVFGAYHTAREANYFATNYMQGVAFAIINIRKIVGAVYVNA